MRITVQEGCETRGLQNAIFQTFAVGRQVQAHAERELRTAEKYLPETAQGDLFGGEE